MIGARRVELFFDFISPYAYLGLCAAEAFAAEHGVAWALQPVVYSKLLDATGLVGPAEVDVKRSYTFVDVLRCAEQDGVPLAGPPAHPFRSIDALRVAWLWREHARGLELVWRLSAAAWADSRDLTDWTVLADVVASMDLDAADLEERCRASEVVNGLRASTSRACELGVFGVPTFRTEDGSLFWGRDRMDHLASHLAAPDATLAARSTRMLSRPRAVDRRRG